MNLTIQSSCTALLVSLAFVGCGPSQQEIMMRAARRPRPKDAGEKVAETLEPPKNHSKTVAQLSNNKTPRATPVSQSTQVTSKALSSIDLVLPETSVVAKTKIESIDQRRPREPLSVEQRRQRAYDSITKISDALSRYADDHNGYFPVRYKTSTSKIPVLSWRVELLPYLGYEELYDQFDFAKPWDMEPNQSLLKFIPDEYVSPERFDAKTNFLLPAHRVFAFGAATAPRLADIEDGPENTILLAEFNDKMAVEWTSPEDYTPANFSTIRKDLSSNRGEGSFAIWANGWPFMISKSVTQDQLVQAMTHASGDRLKAGDIHRKIVLSDASEAEPARMQELVEADERKIETVANTMQIEFEDETLERFSLPNAADSAKASSMLRKVFAARIHDAKRWSDKVKLAEEMLQEAFEMEADPSGAYMLQRAAISLATDAADASVLIKAIDQRVARFDVDAYQENLTRVESFFEKTSAISEGSIKGHDTLLQRLVSITNAAIEANDFARASRITRLSLRLTDRESHGRISRLLNRLRGQIGGAQIEFDKSAESLARYRFFPDDVAAGAAFGKFLCFFKGDWNKGLPLIAAGAANEDLRELAQDDLDGEVDLAKQVALGDGWWDLSRRARGAYRQAAQDRAVYWYSLAIDRMPDSLDRLHVENRLGEADDSDASSPLALCSQLASELGVDLSIGLLDLANHHLPRRSRRGLARAGDNANED